MRAVLASHNKKKMKEMREILAQLGVEVISQAEAGEFYNAASKKVEEGIDSVKESIQSGTGEESITMPPPGQGNSQQ